MLSFSQMTILILLLRRKQNGSSTGAFGQNHNEPRRGRGVMNVRLVICPHAGTILGVLTGSPKVMPKA